MESKNSVATISQPPISEQPVSSSDAIRQFLVKAGEVYGRAITAPLVSIWIEELGAYPVEQLDGMFRHILRTWKPEYGKTFPVIAEVLQPMDVAAKNELASRADLEWQKLLDYIRRYYWADGPWQHKAPKLPEKVRVSCNAAGGFAWLNECSRDDLVWAKKGFVESYIAWEEMNKDQWLLPEGTLRNLLLEASSEKALLPGPVADSEDWLPPVVPSRIAPQYTPDIAKQRAASVDMTSAKTITAETMVVKDPSRMEVLRQQAQKMIAKYPALEQTAEVSA
jgi:hypothetical protein